MNLGTFSGNLTKDCRTSRSATGTAMCFFTIAVNSGYGDRKHVDYIECAIFGKRAEGKLIDYLVKGTQVLVSGDVKLETRDHEGKTYTNMAVNIDKLDLIGGAGKPQAPVSQNSQGYNESQAAVPQSAPQDDFDSDIPF